MDHRVEHRSHHREDGLKVSCYFSWPSLLPIVDFVALFLMLPISLTCESTPQDFQRSSWNQPPAAPSLSWSPSHQILVKGEQIELKCSPPEGQRAENYFFDRMNEKGEWKRYSEKEGNTLLIPALRMVPKATFSCSYTGRNREGRRAQSPRSNWGEFSVIERPPTPSLSPDPPQPLYLVGEKVVLWCSIPNLPLQGRRRYQFSHKRQNEDEASIKDLDWHEGNLSLVLTATRENSGVYKCRYLEWIYERKITSEWSLPVSIVVRDPLPPPVLELHPSSGSLGEGKVLSILCLSSESNNTKRFHFSQDGVEVTSSHEEPVNSSRDPRLLTLNMSVAFLNAKDHQRLGFACRYEENINGSWVMSYWSQTVTVASAPFAPSVAYAALVLLVPFLGAPLVFCWCRRKNASGCQRRSDPKEGETRSNDLGSENLEREDLQDSELTYALVMNSSPLIPLEPRTKNRPNTREEYQVMYSDVRVHAARRAAP